MHLLAPQAGGFTEASCRTVWEARSLTKVLAAGSF